MNPSRPPWNRPFVTRRAGLFPVLMIGLVWLGSGPFPACAYGQATSAPGKVVSPQHHQVFQRAGNGRATIPIMISKGQATCAYLRDADDKDVAGAQFKNGVFSGVPTGGPYTLKICGIQTKDGGQAPTTQEIKNLFVGDLWVLAGGSAMISGGAGAAADKIRVRVAQTWSAPAAAFQGAGVGRPFAAEIVKTAGVPVGLIVDTAGVPVGPIVNTAGVPVGLTVATVGGPVGPILKAVGLPLGFIVHEKLKEEAKGIIWFRDDDPITDPYAIDVTEDMLKKLKDSIKSTRAKFQVSPYILVVQSGRSIIDKDELKKMAAETGWGLKREIQRKAVQSLAKASLISTIDLDLAGERVLGPEEHQRLGRRLALAAEREVYGLAVGATPPKFDWAALFDATMVQVKMSSLNSEPPKAKKAEKVEEAKKDAAATGTAPTANASSAIVQLVVPGGQTTVKKDEKDEDEAVSPNAKPLLAVRSRLSGFSIRDLYGEDLNLIYEAAVASPNDTVELRLKAKPPSGSRLWYGYGSNPVANLVDGLDMAAPAFGPIEIQD